MNEEMPDSQDDSGLDYDEEMPTRDIFSEISEDEDFLSEFDTRPVLAQFSHAIQIFIPQEVDPLTFFDTKRITMGRGGQGIILDIDLSEYHGWMLGVSRKHAEIIFDSGQYYLADLGSTNGTFLNRTKLRPMEHYPLASSDQIRMGHFLMVVSIP